MDPKTYYKLAISNDLDLMEVDELKFLKDLIRDSRVKAITIQELLKEYQDADTSTDDSA
jgi:hypothetical protein